MKKTIKFGIAAFMAVALSVAGYNSSNSNPSGVSLSDLLMTSEANAECIQSSISELNTGGCSMLTGNCYWGAENYSVKCDPFAISH